VIALLLSLVAPAPAASLAGVTLPDTVTVGGRSLVLNGLGLREKLFFDIYVGGLYLPAKTTSAQAAIEEDVPKRIVMHFVYSEVTAAQLVEAYEEGTAKNPAAAAQAASLATLHGWMEAVHPGDEVVLDYVPGTGTTVTVKGATKGTLPGADFMKVLWTVYLGDHPPTGALKAGLLRG
jgi:hypothetical protein